MSVGAIEELEDRQNPAGVVLTGTEGQDSWFIFGQGASSLAIQFVRNGQTQLSVTSLAAATGVTVNAGGGNDVIYHSSNLPLFANMEGGNDTVVVDGAEGGTLHAGGGLGNDLLVGGSNGDAFFGDDGDDVIIGGAGADTIYGWNGEDLLIAESLASGLLPFDVFSAWNTSGQARHERVIATRDLVQTVPDASVDSISDSVDFDLVYEGVENRLQAGPAWGGFDRYINNAAQLPSVIAAALPGDTIILSPGVYELSANIERNLAGITLQGAGMGQTILRGGSLRLDNEGQTAPTYIKGLSIDLTGQTAAGGYVSLANGVFFLDGVEVSGIGQSTAPAIAFRKALSLSTQGIVLNSYVHDALGDLISTTGISGNPGDSATSIVELFDNVGHGSGPSDQDQVLSAHFGFRLVDVGGTYSDSHTNVVAPDNATRLDLYFTTISPGSRRGDVRLTTFDSVIVGATITASSVQTGGLLRDSTLINVGTTGTAFIRPLYGGSVVQNNRIVQTVTGTTKKGVTSYVSSFQLIDNVFENWNGNEWLITGAGSVITGNIVL